MARILRYCPIIMRNGLVEAGGSSYGIDLISSRMEIFCRYAALCRKWIDLISFRMKMFCCYAALCRKRIDFISSQVKMFYCNTVLCRKKYGLFFGWKKKGSAVVIQYNLSSSNHSWMESDKLLPLINGLIITFLSFFHNLWCFLKNFNFSVLVTYKLE